MEPTITRNGPPVRLARGIVVPSKFTATFINGTAEVTLDLVVVDGSVRCTAVLVARPLGSVSADDLRRVRLATDLIPVAVEAAASSLLGGDPDRIPASATVASSEVGVIGEIVVTARIKRDAPRYAAVARTAGRPKHMGSRNDLERVVAVYVSSRGSLASVQDELGLSKSTAWRRLKEARSLGILPEEGARDGSR